LAADPGWVLIGSGVSASMVWRAGKGITVLAKQLETIYNHLPGLGS